MIMNERHTSRKEVIHMTISKIVVAALFAISLMITPAIADEKHGMMGEGMMMCEDMMGRMKEMMGMMKDMSHSPTDTQKKRLEEMMKQMDGVMKMHDDMMMKKEEMMKKKMEKKGM